MDHPVPGAAWAGQLRLGDHVCWCFEDDERILAAMAPVIAHGLTERHKMVYFSEAAPPETVRARLDGHGVPLDRARPGQIQVLPAREAYLPAGRFDAAAMLAGLHRTIAQAQAEGYLGVRLFGDMRWTLSSPPGAEDLLWYEEQVNRIYLDGGAMGVCLYDERAFDDATLRSIASVHPLTNPQHDGDVDWAAQLRMRRTARPYGLQLSGEIDLSNRQALSVALDAVLDEMPDRSAPVVIDVGGVRFADAAAAGMLINAARTCSGGMHVVGCHPAVAMVLDRLGLPLLPGVRMSQAGA